MTFDHYVDLTRTIGNNTLAYPGDPKARIQKLFDCERDGCMLDEVCFCTHTATHVDAAAHMFSDGRALNEYPLLSFEGPAVVLDCAEEEISAAIIRQTLTVAPKWLILRTGWENRWKDGETYFHGKYPVLSMDAIDIICSSGLCGIAMDTPGPDDFEEVVRHKKLLAADKLLAENLCNLAALKNQKEVCLSVWPLKLSSRDGAPARVIARF